LGKEAPNNSIVAKSVAALVTRRRQSKGIKTWADLAKDGVSVITATPKLLAVLAGISGPNGVQ